MSHNSPSDCPAALKEEAARNERPRFEWNFDALAKPEEAQDGQYHYYHQNDPENGHGHLLRLLQLQTVVDGYAPLHRKPMPVELDERNVSASYLGRSWSANTHPIAIAHSIPTSAR
jgi:hypothetical protein